MDPKILKDEEMKDPGRQEIKSFRGSKSLRKH